MTNSKGLFDDLFSKIHLNESPEEISSILYLLLHHLTGLTATDILAGRPMPAPDNAVLEGIIRRVNEHEPIQYILGEADFYGRSFAVNRAVLIPRPETEQLIDEIATYIGAMPEKKGTVLDIGTGSGCIAITLALELPQLKVIASDISAEALKVAEQNAKKNQAKVIFVEHSVFRPPSWPGPIDIIVSNPPYITISEKINMNKNVLDFEPHPALFVPEQDHLIFYRGIASLAQSAMHADGAIFVEINEKFGDEVSSVFISSGFKNTRIKKDINGKDRFVIASAARQIHQAPG